MISSVVLSISLTGSSNTQVVNPPALANGNCPSGALTPTVTVNGNITLTPPAGATGLYIQPLSTSVITKTLKGIAGDQGVPLSPNNWSFFSLPASPGALVLTANGIETLLIAWT